MTRIERCVGVSSSLLDDGLGEEPPVAVALVGTLETTSSWSNTFSECLHLLQREALGLDWSGGNE